jgi:hypothetical protein
MWVNWFSKLILQHYSPLIRPALVTYIFDKRIRSDVNYLAVTY